MSVQGRADRTGHTGADEAEGSVCREGGVCELCGRRMSRLTRHHLIPQTRHSNKRNKQLFDRREVKTRIALLCRACHDQVHVVLDNKALEREYNTLEALKGHPELRRFAEWIGDKPEGLRVATLIQRKRRG